MNFPETKSIVCLRENKTHLIFPWPVYFIKSSDVSTRTVFKVIGDIYLKQ